MCLQDNFIHLKNLHWQLLVGTHFDTVKESHLSVFSFTSHEVETTHQTRQCFFQARSWGEAFLQLGEEGFNPVGGVITKVNRF